MEVVSSEQVVLWVGRMAAAINPIFMPLAS